MGDLISTKIDYEGPAPTAVKAKFEFHNCGALIKFMRHAYGMTQREFAELTEISVSSLQKYETDVIETPGNSLLAIIQKAGYQLVLEPIDQPTDESENENGSQI